MSDKSDTSDESDKTWHKYARRGGVPLRSVLGKFRHCHRDVHESNSQLNLVSLTDNV